MPEHSILVAHRGFAGKYPENTLEALDAACKHGVKKVEIDVQLTKDLVPVMLHDLSLERTKGVQHKITDLDSQNLYGVETIEQVVSWLESNPDVIVFVELKHESIFHHGVGACVRALAEVCKPVISRCVFISIHAAACGIAKHSGFEKMGWVLPAYNRISYKVLSGLKPDYLFCDVEYLDEEKLWPGDWKWVIYEVGSVKLARELLEKGADLIETKQLDELID